MTRRGRLPEQPAPPFVIALAGARPPAGPVRDAAVGEDPHWVGVAGRVTLRLVDTSGPLPLLRGLGSVGRLDRSAPLQPVRHCPWRPAERAADLDRPREARVLAANVEDVPHAGLQVVGDISLVPGRFLSGDPRCCSHGVTGPGEARVAQSHRQTDAGGGIQRHALRDACVTAWRKRAGQGLGDGLKSKATQIYEGTNQVQRMVIARSLLK